MMAGVNRAVASTHANMHLPVWVGQAEGHRNAAVQPRCECARHGGGAGVTHEGHSGPICRRANGSSSSAPDAGAAAAVIARPAIKLLAG